MRKSAAAKNMNVAGALIFIISLVHQVHGGFLYGAPCNPTNTLKLPSNEVYGLPAKIQCVDLSSSTVDSLNPYQHLTKNAKTLYADGMGLTRIPFNLTSAMPYLEHIDLSKNYIKRFHPRGLSDHQRLRTLLLSYNRLFIPKKRCLLFSTSLANLHLDGNQIVQVNAFTFRKVPHLKALSLSHNLLTSVPVEALRPLKNLKYLNLASNRIMRMPPAGTLPTSLAVIITDDNPFDDMADI